MDIKLKFSLKAWAKLNYLMLKGDTEVGGFGLLSPRKDALEVIDFILVPQESTSASVTFDDDGYEDYVEEMGGRGLPADRFMRIWIHTHPGSSPSPSSTDEKSWKETFGTMSWAVMFIIARNGGETYTRLRMGTEFAHLQCEIGAEIDWTLEYPENGAQAEWDAEYERCVKKPVYTQSIGFHSSGNQWRPKQGHSRRAYNYKLHKNPEYGLIPSWMDDDQVDEWEVDPEDKQAYIYVGKSKKTETQLFERVDDDRRNWERRIDDAIRDCDFLTSDGNWEQSLEACRHLATSTPFQMLDEVDWRLIYWYCKSEHVNIEETDKWNLYEFFTHRMAGEEVRDDLEDIDVGGA